MSYRFMRVFVMFDLPTETSVHRKAYRDFRKYLLVNGFIMLQESVYVKLVLNTTIVKLLEKQLREHKPADGNICLLTVTEKQYSKMEILIGETQSEVLDTTERVIVL